MEEDIGAYSHQHSDLSRQHSSLQEHTSETPTMHIGRAGPVAPSGQRAQLAILPDVFPQPMSYTGWGICSTARSGQGSKFQPHTTTSHQSCPTRRYSKRTLAAQEPIPGASQARSPTQYVNYGQWLQVTKVHEQRSWGALEPNLQPCLAAQPRLWPCPIMKFYP